MTEMLSLNGSWQLRQIDSDKIIPATVPGCVHTDLMVVGDIPDPLKDMNELDALWVDEVDWEYSRTFDLPEAFVSSGPVELICEGLDTIAEIEINNQPVASTDNMFRTWRFDVSKLLAAGENTIRVVFRSPIRSAKERSELTEYPLPGSDYNWGYGRTRDTYRPHIRKSQCSFGWDWGPVVATSGIWRDIRLEKADRPRIESVVTQQHHDDEGTVRLEVRAHLLCSEVNTGRLVVEVAGEAGTVEAELEAGETTVVADVTISNPDLWFPVGLGKQPLYPLTVRWMNGAAECDRYETKIGFRNVELIRNEDDSGESFYFQVNKIPVFAKGANWIPADAFPTRLTRERYEDLIRAALDANMNMLRIWGGGIYEPHVFFELCDEYGIMVWQDFMFACACYPADEDFLANVAAEAKDNIRELANHPSLVLWCGNNENEWAVEEWWTNWWKDKPVQPELRPDYDKLTDNTLAKVVAEEDPGRPWWPSSPSSGGETAPNDFDRGDVHFWETWHMGKPLERQLEVVPRFASEFGFQSFPTLDTLKTALDPGDGDVESDILRHHQRHPMGNSIIAKTLDKYMPVPKDFESFCTMSQIMHGTAIKMGIEHWRRNKPRCMGTLYWQLNDCWVVASWASLDYELRYKAPHAFAKRFYAPLMGTIVESGESLNLWATSDIEDFVDGTWRLEAWNIRTGQADIHTGELSLDPQDSRMFMSLPRESVITPDEEKEVVLRLILETNEHRHENLHHFVPFKDMTLPKATIRVADRSDAAELETDACAFYVEVAPAKGRCIVSDNFFFLPPGETKTIQRLTESKEPLNVRSLVDMIQ